MYAVMNLVVSLQVLMCRIILLSLVKVCTHPS
nr:MAG TPA: hypothetical protein [Caudoviricetes sp.]